MAISDAVELTRWFVDRGYAAFHNEPRPVTAGRHSSWLKSNKHQQLTGRDLEFVRTYIGIALAAGIPFRARGLHIEGSGYVHLDKAVMNSCLNGGVVQLNEATGTFELTLLGTKRLLSAG